MQPTILVPLDGSKRAEAILPIAVTLAQATGSALSLLEVVEPETGEGDTALQTWDRLQEEARAYLEDLAMRLGKGETRVVARAVIGRPATRIVQTARREPRLTCIAMATHARGGVLRWMFGSVAEEVLRHVSVPLLLLRDGQPPAPCLGADCVVLVPLDGSDFARRALGEAETLARQFGGSLLLASVVPERDATAPPEADLSAETRARWRRREAAWLSAELEKTARGVESRGVHVRTRLLQGQPGAMIAELAGQAGVALIVMATHGRSGADERRWGSVALEVLRRAPTPVLLLGPDQTTAAPEFFRDLAGSVWTE